MKTFGEREYPIEHELGVHHPHPPQAADPEPEKVLAARRDELAAPESAPAAAPETAETPRQARARARAEALAAKEEANGTSDGSSPQSAPQV